MPDTFWSELARQGPLVAMLLFFLWGFVTKKWVLGWQYDEARRDRDEYKALAFDLLHVAEKAVDGR